MNCALSRTFVTEAELLKRIATADGDCALGSRSVSASQLDAYKLAGLVALSKDLGYDGSQRFNDEAINPELQPSSVERPPKSPRRPAPNTSSITATSSPEACDEGHDAEWRGRVAAPCIACSNFIACVGPARADGLASDATSAHGVEVIDISPAGGHKAVGLSLWASLLPSLGVPSRLCRVPQAALTATVVSSAP